MSDLGDPFVCPMIAKCFILLRHELGLTFCCEKYETSDMHADGSSRRNRPSRAHANIIHQRPEDAL